ncbi:hypothetical protein QYE76_054626 [Lolium multiflorum]|uniref:CCHC-type domain-containing protein n=1 Tax=Lolium multiflorum TaxID=4521 RepID=A0AAD8SYY4_LOLMU|nr:hypothetical protein QYE76_054626 [Lolium multiflorum]
MVKVGETSAPVVETVGPALYPRLDRKDYGLWALNMEVAMEAAEIWEAVDPGGNDYVKGGAKYTKDRKALTAIYSVVPKDVMQHLVGKKSAKDAWETIKTLHQGHARVREAHLQTLTKSYEDLKMEESETVDQFAARFVTLINAIRGYGERLDEVKNVRRFLRAAPARHMQIVTSIEQCLDLNTLTVEDLVGRFKAHDERIRLSFDDPDQSEHLMLTKQQWMTLSKEKQGGSTSRSNGKEKQRPAKKYIAEEEEDDEAPPRRKFDIKKVRCHKCGKLGHFKSDCREPPKERAFMAQQGDDGPMMLMLEECEQMDKEELGPPVSAMEIVTLVEEKVYLHDKRGTKTGGNVWCLDTGASNHMTGDKSLFSELDLSVGGTVRFGDGSTVDIAGRGNVLLEMQYGGPKKKLLVRSWIQRKHQGLTSQKELALSNNAAEDGRSVCLDRRAASRNAVWAVTVDLCEATATTHVLLRGAYGRYLGAPDATAGCSCLPTCRAAAQRDRHGERVLALLWRPCPTTRQGVFRLCDPSGRYLRANPGCLLPPCRRGVSVSACAGASRGLGKAIQWVFEPVPRGARPLLQRPPESLWGRLFAHVPLSGLCMRWFSGREIRWQRADESGAISEDNWRSTRFTGRHTILLERQLVGLLPREIGSHPKYTVCVRAGLSGLPTPLAIDLPRSREPLNVVLFAPTGQSAKLTSFLYL